MSARIVVSVANVTRALVLGTRVVTGPREKEATTLREYFKKRRLPLSGKAPGGFPDVYDTKLLQDKNGDILRENGCAILDKNAHGYRADFWNVQSDGFVALPQERKGIDENIKGDGFITLPVHLRGLREIEGDMSVFQRRSDAHSEIVYAVRFAVNRLRYSLPCACKNEDVCQCLLTSKMHNRVVTPDDIRAFLKTTAGDFSDEEGSDEDTQSVPSSDDEEDKRSVPSDEDTQGVSSDEESLEEKDTRHSPKCARSRFIVDFDLCGSTESDDAGAGSGTRIHYASGVKDLSKIQKSWEEDSEEEFTIVYDEELLAEYLAIECQFIRLWCNRERMMEVDRLAREWVRSHPKFQAKL